MFWYEIDFIQDNWRWEFKSIGEMPGSLQVQDDTETILTLQREKPGTSNETLGTWLAPDGAEELQVKSLQAKLATLADAIPCSRSLQKDTLMAMKLTIWKSLEFPMATTSIIKVD